MMKMEHGGDEMINDGQMMDQGLLPANTVTSGRLVGTHTCRTIYKIYQLEVSLCLQCKARAGSMHYHACMS